MTELLYMSNMQQLECDSSVVAVEEREAGMVVALDRTVFYPQGGGQPYDTGIIRSSGSSFSVRQVRWDERRVLHIGSFEHGSFASGELVHCSVDAERRALHSRLHSAGHVVDMAVERLGYRWIPGKGYHFPDGPYVEYEGELHGDKEETRRAIEEAANDLTSSATRTEVRFLSRDELASVCRFVPDYVPLDKPSRVVMYGSFGVPCGGTHVANLSDIGAITIRKLKASGGTLRVSYGVST